MINTLCVARIILIISILIKIRVGISSTLIFAILLLDRCLRSTLQIRGPRCCNSGCLGEILT